MRAMLCATVFVWVGVSNGGPCRLLAAETPFSSPSIEASPSPSPQPQSSPVPLVPYAKLVPFLPEPPHGWGAERPDGSTTNSGEIKLSTVRRSYFKGDADDAPTASVTIIDSINNQDDFDSAASSGPPVSETAEGYDKRIEIQGMRAIEHYNKAAKTCSLSVFAGKRYFVQIELTNLDPKELREWFKLIDIKGLEALK